MTLQGAVEGGKMTSREELLKGVVDVEELLKGVVDGKELLKEVVEEGGC